jgi:hypothetical protein
MKCPICNKELSGIVYSNKKSISKAKTILAKKMRKKGYTFQEIMKEVGWKSPNAVTRALKR